MLNRFESYVIALITPIAFTIIGSLDLAGHGSVLYAYMAFLGGGSIACALMISGLYEMWTNFSRPDLVDYLMGWRGNDET
jgi:hypothetical protein